MTTVRYDVLSGTFSVIAQERSKRPVDFARAQKRTETARNRTGECPFCPGNERMTPPEVSALRGAGGPDEPGWLVRTVPNKFPAFVPLQDAGEEEKVAFARTIEEVEEIGEVPEIAMFWELPAIGAHEVVIDSPAHDGTLGSYSQDTAFRIIRMLRDRHRALSTREEISYVHVFRNSGPEGGASLSHPHFQIIGLPFVPESVQGERTRLHRYLKRTGRCLLCDLVERELEKDERVVIKEDEFRVIAPFASRFSYEVLIVPKVHRSSFGDIGDPECLALGKTLVDLFSRYERLFASLSYNVVWHSAPGFPRTGSEFHWHIHVFPRLTTMAGLELGTGIFINPTSPEMAATLLRGDTAAAGTAGKNGRR